jgi:hypothetical protein
MRRQKFTPEIENIVNRNIVKKLRPTFEDCGFLYLVSNPCWPENVFKLGETDSLLQRFNGYNGHNPEPIVCRYLIVCTDVKAIEAEIKKKVREMKVCLKENSNEWVKIEEEKIIELFHEFVVKDEELTRDCEMPIYKRAVSTTPVDAAVAASTENVEKALSKIMHNGFTFLQPRFKDIEVKDSSSERKAPRMDFLPRKPPELRKPAPPRKKKEKKMSFVPPLVTPPAVAGAGAVYFDSKNEEWIANKNGEKKTFSVKKFGSRDAFALALSWRMSR